MLSKKDFLAVADCSREEILALLKRSAEIKKGMPGKGPALPLQGRFVGLLFEKPSTRTRVSFEVAVRQMGGDTIFLSRRDIQMGRGEPIRDTARVLSRYLDALVVRTFGHHIVEELAEWSSIPVINGLTDLHHPCQVLADLFTLQEAGLDVTAIRAAWIGDGNNMANSWIEAARALGFSLALACPEGYEPAVDFNSDRITLSRNPKEVVRGADVISTDVWASMGQEDEAAVRAKAFAHYRVDGDLLAHAPERVFVLHCLPAHRGEEITDEVMESRHSLIWDQAENRLHVQKAILEMLMSHGPVDRP
ncbi:MAG: ornithine carbamoyltransferase [Deltaproteobacteria bacterium]|nr:ornithine carbamoyltransferase [Deltaproteobacteria bacterium]